jgi:hypothetical protein
MADAGGKSGDDGIMGAPAIVGRFGNGPEPLGGNDECAGENGTDAVAGGAV